MKLRLSSLFLFIMTATLSAQTPVMRVLEKDEVIQGTSFKKGTIVYQDKNKYLHKAVLAEDQPLADKILGASFPHIFPKGSTVIFKNPVNMFGKPESNAHLPDKIIVSRRMTIFGVPIAAQSEVIVFGGSMTIEGRTEYFAGVSLVLLEDITIKGKLVKKDDYIKIETKDSIQVSKGGEWEDL